MDVQYELSVDLLELVAAERRRQIEQGWTTGHDDTHKEQDWLVLLVTRLARVGEATWETREEFQERLVQLIAVAVAAWDERDRWDRWERKVAALP